MTFAEIIEIAPVHSSMVTVRCSFDFVHYEEHRGDHMRAKAKADPRRKDWKAIKLRRIQDGKCIRCCIVHDKSRGQCCPKCATEHARKSFLAKNG